MALVGVAGVLALSGGLGSGEDEPERGTGATPLLPLPLETAPGRITGYVRDLNGKPIARARVRLSRSARSSVTDSRGHYELRGVRGAQTLIARKPGFGSDRVTTAVSADSGARVDFSLPSTGPRRASPDSADRVILWTGCRAIARLSKAQLDAWVRRGVDGFVCQTGRLRALGGQHAFSPRRRGRLRGPQYALQRRLRSSAVVKRARAGKLALFLGFYAAGGPTASTPFADWFDDARWQRSVLPGARALAGAARRLGFVGVAIDQELYPTAAGSPEATWSWSYPGNGRAERAVRRKAKQRGKQLMEALGRAHPGLELAAYDTQLPETWSEKVQADVNGRSNQYARDLRVNFWDGIAGIRRYSAIRWFDATFYKTPHVSGSSWDSALQYNANRVYSLLSRRFSNWSYAWSRLHLSPFAWIDPGPSDFERARDPAYVAEQLRAFRRWGAGGAFATYNYGHFGGFDYGPYEEAMRAASTPGRVDRSPPRLALRAPGPAHGRTVDLSGSARDNMAVRAVRWEDDRGRSGMARLTWRIESGNPRAGWRWRTDWSIKGLRVPRGRTRVRVSAIDLKGLSGSRSVTLSR